MMPTAIAFAGGRQSDTQQIPEAVQPLFHRT
jgi:hypothetical protein